MLSPLRWIDKLNDVLRQAAKPAQIEQVLEMMQATQERGNKIIFIGNGGSAAIASHMAEDYTKNGGMQAMAFNDAALITCFANDYGWDNWFQKALEHYGNTGDLLVAISSSGNSQNILKAAGWWEFKGRQLITLSGFSAESPLTKFGLNFFVNAQDYGFVEISHLAILHLVLDIHTGVKI